MSGARWLGRGPVRRRLMVGAAVLASFSCMVATSALAASTTLPSAGGASAPVRQPAVVAAASPGAFTQTQTVTRTHLVNGQDVPVDSRSVTLNVDVTTNLINRQPISVSWSGAHPTGGVYRNPNDPGMAPYQEYPMVLLECHGTASSIQPEDCWTSTPSERFFSGQTIFPPWRLDRYATGSAQRAVSANQPAPFPAACGSPSSYPTYWLHYLTPATPPQDFPIGSAGCAGMPNEMNLTGGLGILPSNETFASTSTSGSGSAKFIVWTSQTALDLGCSQQVPCALVAVPIMGISCDPAGSNLRPTDPDVTACEGTGDYAAGVPIQSPGQLTVSGALWWAASNWRNRFVVPLTFAPSADVCTTANPNSNLIQFYGSGLMNQASLQWQPHFCLDPTLFKVGFTEESEPFAASSINDATAEAALVAQQPASGFVEPVVHAPVAATGFAISFVIDDSHGAPVTTLNMTPRLLAKLLSESYPAMTDIAPGYPDTTAADPELLHPCPGVAITGSTLCTNPQDITLDPEFQALNPSVPKGVHDTQASAILLALSSNSDLTSALTSYINADPAARAFLDGTPDPWGMVVNSAYKKISLPVFKWPQLSTFIVKRWQDGFGGPGTCYEGTNAVPVFQLIANPVLDLTTLAEDLQFSAPQWQTGPCVGTDNGNVGRFGTPSPQQPGFRFMIGITALADAQRYGVPTASLLTYTAPGTPAKFTSAAGMTFVAPTDASLSSAASLLVADTKNNVWTFPYDLYHTNSTKSQQAYPGFMLVYADIPTSLTGAAASKLPNADATDYATFLKFAAGAGQTPGGGVGQLPSGYLPMTAANHLGGQAAYTVTAAAAVAAQNGTVPPIVPVSPSKSPSPTGSATSSHTPSPSASGTGPSASATGSHSASPSGSGSSPAAGQSAAGSGGSKITLTPAANFGLIGYVLPIMAGLALIAAAGALVASRTARARGKRWG